MDLARSHAMIITSLTSSLPLNNIKLDTMTECTTAACIACSLTHEHRFYKVGGADLRGSVDHTLHLVLVHLSVCFDLVL